MYMGVYRRFVVFFLCCSLMVACLPAPHFQKQVAIPGNEWAYNFVPQFDFGISDTTAQYRPYFIIRHTQAYPYNNIWLWVSVKGPGDTIAKRVRINVTLAEASGKWLGRGMGEIYEQRMPLSLGDSISFSRYGGYQIKLEQNMRVNPLPEVLHVGMRVEKTKPRNMR